MGIECNFIELGFGNVTPFKNTHTKLPKCFQLGLPFTRKP